MGVFASYLGALTCTRGVVLCPSAPDSPDAIWHQCTGLDAQGASLRPLVLLPKNIIAKFLLEISYAYARVCISLPNAIMLYN